MLTRAQLFSQAPAEVEAGATCPICLEVLEGRHPLRFRCNPEHVYCKACIRPWAMQHRRCTFMCEIRPYDPAPWTEISPALINQTRADMRDATMYTFGVPSGLTADFVTGPFTFSEDDTNVPHDGHWVKYLAGRREPNLVGIPMFDVGLDSTVIAGTGLSEPERMFIPILSLANAIPLLAANAGRPYSDTDMLNWRLVATGLVSDITKRTLIFTEIEFVPLRCKANVRISLAASGSRVEDIPFFQSGPLGSDLDLLTEYVAYTMFREAWMTPIHTPAGLAMLQAYRRHRAVEARLFQRATWMLEDSGRQCATM